MLPNKVFHVPAKAIGVAVFLTSYFYSEFSYAATATLSDMVENLSTVIPSFMQLVTALAYVMGMFMIFKGILALKQYGESRTMMSSQHDLKGPIVYIMVGTLLLYIPSSVQTALNTFWTNPTPYAYENDLSDQWSTLINDCYLIIQLIGTIAFIRGLLILSQLGAGQGVQPGTFGKGMAHIVGGILCINIYQFVQVIMNTLSLGQ